VALPSTTDAAHMETVLFRSPHAPALAEAAARHFNDAASGNVRAYADELPRDVSRPIALLVTMGGGSPEGVTYTLRDEWSAFDPRAMRAGTEQANLTSLQRQVHNLVRDRGWMKPAASHIASSSGPRDAAAGHSS
jgi:hypothetical protein